jgi:cellulose synthase/poly-beta-1,6-N-acetylglucosamine synthase-like glycosyltransferase
MPATETLFWIALIGVAYVYVGYPALAAALARVRPRPVRSGRWEPSVSLVVAARNESDRIAAKIDDCRALDWPADKLEIVVSLDGSTDGTAEIARGRREGSPRVVVVEGRRARGKAVALNRGVAQARGEVIVFCDARQRVAPDALRHLTSALADPAVGAVTGELVLVDDEGREASDGVGLYWRYEKALRSAESRIHSLLGATGALYAVRRELLAPLPEQAILDDVIAPMRVVLAGRRVVFEPRARVFDRVCPPRLEFRRKVRTLVGNYQLLRLMPELLDPGRNPVLLQLVSHKLGRLAAPHLLVVLLVSNLFLREGVYLVFLVGQCGFYLAACAGACIQRSSERPAAPALPGGRQLGR